MRKMRGETVRGEIWEEKKRREKHKRRRKRADTNEGRKNGRIKNKNRKKLN